MSNLVEKIILNCNEFKMLLDEKARGNLAKSILLISKDSNYAFEFAKLLSCAIINQNFYKNLENDENYQKIKALSHPDVKIYPEKEKLLVADSEKIVLESAVKPIFADKKIFIIKNIENSMEAAQNKLLKTLEEPQANVYFILTTSSINLVLPTIKSRCNKIELKKLSDKEMFEFLDYQKNSDLICAICEGNIGEAEKLKEIKNLDEIFENVLSLVCDLKSSKQILEYSKKILDFPLSQQYVFSWLALIFEDLINIKAKRSLRLKKYQEKLEEVENEYTLPAILKVCQLIDKAMEEISFNCNFNLVLENLLLNILEEKFLCK